MRKTLLWLAFFGLISATHGKYASLSEYRRPLEWKEEISAEDYKKIEELANYLRSRAEEAEDAPISFGKNGNDKARTWQNPYMEREDFAFPYNFPNVNPQLAKGAPFAVDPSDPRYYYDFVSAPKGPQQEREKFDGPKRKEVLPGNSKHESLDVISADITQIPPRSTVDQVPVANTEGSRSDIFIAGIIAGCGAAVVIAVIAIGLSIYRLQKNAKAAAEVDYPAYGVTGPHKDVSPTSGDRRLAQSAQMYHYQHQKQQIIAMESRAGSDRHGSISDAESDEENEEGDYTVYECPGLASTGEMEVKNPLFHDDQTPDAPAREGAASSKPAQDIPK